LKIIACKYNTTLVHNSLCVKFAVKNEIGYVAQNNLSSSNKRKLLNLKENVKTATPIAVNSFLGKPFVNTCIFEETVGKIEFSKTKTPR